MFKLSVISTTATFAAVPSSANVDEGITFTINLTTTGVQNGQPIPYTITGVSSADIDGASLTGTFIVYGGTAFRSFRVTADALAEGAETMTLTFDGINESVNVVFNDVTVGDPYWDQTVLLMHMETAFKDEKNHTVSSTGGSTTLTQTDKKFGEKSLITTGGNGNTHLYTDSSNDFVLGQTFTIESWIKFSDNQSGTIFASGILNSKISFAIGSGASIFAFSLGSGGWGWQETLTFDFQRQSNVWYHLAICVSSRTVTIFINGTSLGTKTIGADIPSNGPYVFSIGGYLGPVNGVVDLNGYLDEVRITKGIARYTSNFTVPTAAFPDQ